MSPSAVIPEEWTNGAVKSKVNGEVNGSKSSEAPRLQRLPPTSTPEEVYEVLMRDGGLIIEQLTDSNTIDRVCQEIQPYLNADAPHEGVTFPKESKRVTGLAGKSRTFATELMNHPLYQAVARKLLTKETTIWTGSVKSTSRSDPQLTNSMAFWVGPGSEAQGLHRDDQCHHTRHPAKYETDLGIMFAGTESRKANGATNVVPFSHKWDDERKPKWSECTQAEMRKGDAFMWLGSVYHGAGHNTTTDEYRLLFAAFMTPGYLRQDENQYLAIPLDVIESYPAEVQKLLGYSVSRPWGGFVEQMEPMDFLKAKGDWTKYVPGDLV